MSSVAVVDNYDSFTWNLVQLLAELGAQPAVYRNDEVEVTDLVGHDALVISPGPGCPADAGISLAAVRELSRRMPILGVCLGHQCIGAAYGAGIVRAGRPMHGKASRIRHAGRGIFAGLPNPFRAARYHSLVVARAGAMTLAELCAWGKPSILVPLPTAAADHQTQNALALAAAGAAIHLAEAELTPHTLAERVRSLLGDEERLAALSAAARARGHPDAAREIVSKILTLT